MQVEEGENDNSDNNRCLKEILYDIPMVQNAMNDI